MERRAISVMELYVSIVFYRALSHKFKLQILVYDIEAYITHILQFYRCCVKRLDNRFTNLLVIENLKNIPIAS